MTYAYQTFSSGQVLTDTEAQQIEDNVRDHTHGQSGVGPSGLSWSVSSKAASFGVVSTDAGKLHKLYGDIDVDFAAAATLGANFGAGFINCSTGRITLRAASGQYIHENSQYVLVPGEGLSVHSDGIELNVLGGMPSGPVRLARVTTVGSMAEVPMTKLFPGDFAWYELRASVMTQSTAVVKFQISVNSGSSYATNSYQSSTTDNDGVRIFNGTTNSAQAQLSVTEFQNGDQQKSLAVAFLTRYVTKETSAGPTAKQLDIAYNTAVRGMLNAIKFLPETGSFGSGCVFELYGFGRPRR